MGHGHSHDDLFGDAVERLEALFEDSEQAMYVFMDDHLKWCNQRFATLLGYRDPQEWADVVEDIPRVFVADDAVESVIRTFQATLEKGVATDVAVTWKRKDGKPVKTRTIFVPFDHEGHRMALHFIRPA